MSDVSLRYRQVAAEFTQRAEAVPAAAWDNPAPCDGWVARDVVRHIVEWMPAFLLANWGVAGPAVPSADEDPLGGWIVVSDAIGGALDDPDVAGRERDSPAGRKTFEDAVAMFCIPDVLIHTWDLARATGLDETLDVDEVHRYLTGVEQMDETMDRLMRDSGHYGPRVNVPGDADEQTRLLAFLGRRP
jgi:uncharacterized protein (TIGR03086 family)